MSGPDVGSAAGNVPHVERRLAAILSADVKDYSRSTQRKAIGSAAVENVAKRPFEKTASRAIQAHTQASGQRRQARRDSR